MRRFDFVCGMVLLVAMAACDQMPAAPTGVASGAITAVRPPGAGPAPPPPGNYVVTFLQTPENISVTSLPVSDPSVLFRVHVDDASGQPAQTGSVLYERCMSTGANSRVVPSSECANGTARWRRWVDIEVNTQGNTYAGVDIVDNPCVMGLRMTFHGSRTIASKQLGPFDFTWTAG